MCDTLIKLTENGYLFGKNSDRSPNEPNLSIFLPRMETTSETLRCTYIEIPQVPVTYACHLVKPSWIWGAEMGVNEFGVVIGNEAVFTKSKDKKTERLIGMDLLRLALERAATAKEAVEVITGLLEKYGQGGNCGFDKPFYYDNSYLVSDPEEAYLLETSGREWVVNNIKDQGNISNRLSIHEDYISSSENNPVDFFKEHTEPVFTHFSGSYDRQNQGRCFLEKQKQVTVLDMINILKSHEDLSNKQLYSKGSLKSVCMHKSFLGDHTTSSMIVQCENRHITIWMTGASTPCLSLYKPLYFGLNGSIAFRNESDAFDYWLRQESLRRHIFAGYVQESYSTELSSLQNQILEASMKFTSLHHPLEELRTFQEDCFKKEMIWLSPYYEKYSFDKLPHLKTSRRWSSLNLKLGKNVFEKQLEMRTKK